MKSQLQENFQLFHTEIFLLLLCVLNQMLIGMLNSTFIAETKEEEKHKSSESWRSPDPQPKEEEAGRGARSLEMVTQTFIQYLYRLLTYLYISTQLRN